MSDIFNGDTIDRALVREVAGFAESRLQEPTSLAGLSELEADVLGTITAKGIIGNGGFTYWYEGMDGAQTLSVALSFERMGMARAAGAMRESLAALREGGLPQNLGEPQTYVSNHRAELVAQFGPLNEVIWDCDHDLMAARYVFRRRRELLAIEPGFGPLLQRYEAADRNRTDRLLAVARGLGVSASRREVHASRPPRRATSRPRWTRRHRGARTLGRRAGASSRRSLVRWGTTGERTAVRGGGGSREEARSASQWDSCARAS
jgi:hypothetical protein